MSAVPSSSSFRSVRGAAVPVPSLGADEACAVADEAFQRYTSPSLRRGGVVWFRNDLRVLDNEALLRAWAASEAVLPVYCVDPRVFAGSTHYFGLPKTGALRAQFLIECLGDLKQSLRKKGLDLLVRHSKPEEILPSIAKAVSAHTIYAHKETCSEEFLVERLVSKGLEQVQIGQGGASVPKKPLNPRLQLIWGATMYHIDDLPFPVNNLPDVYTQFRKAVESKSLVRNCTKLPLSLCPPPSSSIDEIGGWGTISTAESLGLSVTKSEKGMHFIGGEKAALGRVHEYFWKKDQLKDYKVKRYEKQRVANDSTYWVLFELIWRDYFRFLSAKYGNAIFHLDMGIDWRMGAEWFETCLLDYDPASNYGSWTYGAGVGNDPREDRYFSIPKQAKTYDPKGEYVAYWFTELRSLTKERRNFPGASYIRQIVPLKFDGENQKDQQFNRQRRPNNMYRRQVK
ncbi:unnamed protein product [Miscanthus lutarioriparius]|uniref:Photolyase/cryptochrome alpha/beta domain-containing protein n=1 Tax=Miscanthus lutarioriparius TaxID=422564 RepID=A0A811S8B0_9POAL|nr:unnamed protein product [Miscanthus lutarioriparius]